MFFFFFDHLCGIFLLSSNKENYQCRRQKIDKRNIEKVDISLLSFQGVKEVFLQVFANFFSYLRIIMALKGLFVVRMRMKMEAKSCANISQNLLYCSPSYTSTYIGTPKFLTKALWVYSHLKSDFFSEKKLLNVIQHFSSSLKITQKWLKDVS